MGLHETSDLNAPSTIADGLWIKYRMSSNWATKAWSNTLTSFQRISATISNSEARSAVALRYSNFLYRIDQHLPNGLDECILQWFNESGPGQLPTLNPETWEILERTLFHLVVQGALKTTTILHGLVYPAWNSVSTFDSIEAPQLAYLNAVNKLCKELLLQDDQSGIAGTQHLFDMQRIRTRRQAVYYEPHFSKLAGSIPLLIYLENLEKLPADLRSNMSCLRRRICQDPGFRQGAYRNLDVIREAFEASPYLMGTCYDNLRKEAISGLKLILWDAVDGKALVPLQSFQFLDQVPY
jgi:mediator of RNA polymerase II transcription subunit 12